MWHVISFREVYEHEQEDPNAHVWTLSQDPNEEGWTTDSGCDGYGLTKAQAQELANAANERRFAGWGYYFDGVSGSYTRNK